MGHRPSRGAQGRRVGVYLSPGVQVTCTASCSVCGPITRTGRGTLDYYVQKHMDDHPPSDRTVGPTKATIECHPTPQEEDT